MTFFYIFIFYFFFILICSLFLIPIKNYTNPNPFEKIRL